MAKNQTQTSELDISLESFFAIKIQIAKNNVANRDFESGVFNSSQKMALRTFYFVRAPIKALAYYYINCSQRHLLAAIENNQF